MTTSITPDPTDEEAAAIAAAVSVVMSQGAATSDARAEVPRWRWSGRWWSKPAIVRRDRPW